MMEHKDSTPADSYLEVNKVLWNAKTDVHFASDFYNVSGFLAGDNTLNAIELGLLGDIAGKRILHLQCHFGMDTLSLARLGARVTGVDFSDKAIATAQQLAEQTNLTADFICCDVYSLAEQLHEQFDIVFSSYGTIGWLPHMTKWAQIVAHFTKPGGKFVFAEFHPVLWMYDNDFTSVAYSYFNTGPIIETLVGTYADRDAPLKHKEIGWNHSLTEVIEALLAAGLSLDRFIEQNYSNYNCFSNMIEVASGQFHIKGFEGKLPMVYALQMTRK